MTSQFPTHAELHAAFSFPDWCGHNWDAFNDCFGEYVEENDGALVAVVWRHIEVAAHAGPAATMGVGWGLLGCKLGIGQRSGLVPSGQCAWNGSPSATGWTSTVRTDPENALISRDPATCCMRGVATVRALSSVATLAFHDERRTRPHKCHDDDGAGYPRHHLGLGESVSQP